ncbi:MAG: radical SAM family heme chaperone HemW [Bryobacteraceae bacterium]|nr:radical SAM family heme chaperone HemW [Bryobacteraceae bacterium]
MSGAYLSFPFCAQKCTFCNFASGVFPAELERDYVNALVAEIRGCQWRWIPETVYIGGGTPSRIGPDALEAILEVLPGRPWLEATIEAAPGTLTPAIVQAWVKTGINRVSLGVQSFVSQELSRTGRRHNAVTVASDVALLLSAGITNFNIDLIAGLPWQTPESWAESLDWLQKIEPPHVSVYMFEIDEDSRLGLELIEGGSHYSASAVPGNDLVADFYETAVARLHAMGIERYEISNFAVPGKESLHNLKYWLLDPYLGFGADAHSFDQNKRWGNVESAAEYVARWRDGKSTALESVEAIDYQERFFVGLRLMRGIRTTTADRNRYGKTIERLRQDGLLTMDGDRLKLTDKGVLMSNEVFEEFVS